ncbi:ArdC family protein [Rhizobium leguminosarum]|uniref:N-terminal domain-containing protein n=1 Tax=Rhizobium leguminosarum TaxID=384 RepID=A0A1B1CK97_RHILE|nr:hypothetical protein BA011_40360 [Rhizobium leguminosarum]
MLGAGQGFRRGSAPIWMTFKQAQELGASVCKGEGEELPLNPFWRGSAAGIIGIHCKNSIH